MTSTTSPTAPPPPLGEPPRRKRPRRTPKGRQVDPQALQEVRALLTDRSRRRDLLIEHLHPYGPGVDLAAYRAAGGYALLTACLAGKRPREEIIAAVSDADLRGLGGAGFPTGRKWELVRKEPAPRLVAVNADEGEPGTFKDRYYLEQDPHRFLEGMLIAAWVVDAREIYVYIRDEYPEIRLMLADETSKVEQAGLAPHAKLHLRRGAGAYICGEESAMIESI